MVYFRLLAVRFLIASIPLLSGVLFAGFAAAAQVEVVLLDGTSFSGSSPRIVDRVVQVSTQSGRKEWPFDKVSQLTIQEKSTASVIPNPNSTSDWLRLIDGSRIACSSFRGRDDVWKAVEAGGKPLEIPSGIVESLQFGNAAPTLIEQWKAISSEARTEDQLAIIRPGDSMDVAPGLIGEISDEYVEFSFDGQAVQAPRAKLLGVLWYRTPNTRVEPTVRLRMKNGSAWEAVELKSGDDGSEAELSWKSRAGIAAQARWSEIESIDFSVANLVWLASETPVESLVATRSNFKTSLSARDKLFAPRFVSSKGDDNSKSKDLVFAAPGKIAFRIPEGFPRFVSLIHRSETARVVSTIVCEVWDGESMVWSRTLKPDESTVAVDTRVTAGKKLALVVRSESELMIGTKVYWDQPRLTR